MNRKKIKVIAIFFALCMIFSLVFQSPAAVEAAVKVLSDFGVSALTEDEVGKDLYLLDLATLNNEDSYVGMFKSNSNFCYYYGTSEDMINWDLTAQYFDFAYGNNTYVGLSSDSEGNHKVHYTKDGVAWHEVALAKGISPLSVKFENEYFKLYLRDENGKYGLYLSKDASSWLDISNDIPEGAYVQNVIVKDNKVYSIASPNVTGKDFIISSASTITENKTEWTAIDSLKKDGYGMLDMMFDGATVGVQLYSIANYSTDKGVGDLLYFVSSDFVNWTEKDWSKENGSYSIFDYSSTEKTNIRVDGKRFEDVEVYPYQDGEQVYYASYVVHSEDGNTWKKELVNVFLNKKKISRDPADKNAFDIPASLEWSRKGVEYSLSRDYISLWQDDPLSKSISRGSCLELIMQALDVKAPETPVKDFVRFTDIYEANSLINRAKMLELVKGKPDNSFDYYSDITRQDMMVMTFNILLKFGQIEADTSLAALQDYTDKDQISEYARVAVSSLIKSGIIKGDGKNVNPLNNITNAEAMTIAQKLNQFRDR